MAGKYEKAASQFVSVLLHSGTNTHFMHLQTKSFAEHMALGAYYEGIQDIVDRWAEAYQGIYDVISDYPNTFHVAKDPKTYLTQIKDFVDKNRDALPDDTQLQNIVDEVCELIDTTLYKLRFLH